MIRHDQSLSWSDLRHIRDKFYTPTEMHKLRRGTYAIQWSFQNCTACDLIFGRADLGQPWLCAQLRQNETPVETLFHRKYKYSLILFVHLLSLSLAKRITDWQPRYGKRSRGRQVKRWRDDIVQMKGITWGRDAGQQDDWRRDAEGYILQWMDGASV